MNLNTPCQFRGNGKQVARPMIKVGRRNVIYTRWIWEKLHGPIPKGLFVCHGCDVGNCINPEHLYLDTNRNNVLRAWKLGRNPKGRKLNRAKVLEILKRLKRGDRRKFIMKDFGITVRHLSKIATGKAWPKTFSQSQS